MQRGVKQCVGFHTAGTGLRSTPVDSDARASADDERRILSFLDACAERLSALAGSGLAGAGAEAFRRALKGSSPLPVLPSWLPVLDTIDAVDHTPLALQFVRISPLLPWQPTFRTDDQGTLIALAPMNEVRRMDGVTVGLLYVGPGQQYPLHSHPPNELYLTLAGTARWRFGGDTDLREVDPTSVILNRPNDLHTTIAGPTPLVALYVLWE